ncbi:hypothetical protein BJ944DRAFT_273484 [Cunninghamella echinulata]|nr:hypothetical protein BJ944DRAFT_273484 [Cunninghamella echinulata]
MEYSNRQSPGDPIFWRLCDDQHCHCDFRMTITHCLDHRGLYIINMIDIVWSGLATIIAFGILIDRLYLKKLPIFDFSGKIPRPKPVESLVFFVFFFNVFRVLNASILILDIGRNAILRAVLFEVPWQLGMTALSCYFFGVCHTLANSSQHLYSSWVGSQSIVDIVGFVVIALPILVINPISLTAGYYAQIGDIDNAAKWTEAIYYSWGAFDFIIGSLILVAGLRLIRVLKRHLSTQGNLRENIIKIKLGAAKIKIISIIGCACLWGYCIVINLYASSRYTIMLDQPYTIVITSIILFNGPLASCVIEFAIILNVKLLNGFNNLSIGSTGNDYSDSADYTSQQQQEQQKNTSKSTDRDDDHRYSFSLSNRLQTENIWTRQDTLACQQQQRDDEEDRYRKRSKDSADHHTYHLSSLSSAYLLQQQQLEDGGKKSDESSVEEDQRQYNALAHQLRMPSH